MLSDSFCCDKFAQTQTCLLVSTQMFGHEKRMIPSFIDRVITTKVCGQRLESGSRIYSYIYVNTVY